MDIRRATEEYERWVRRATPVVASQLRAKHALMRDDRFAFFRGTFYRWAQLWPSLCPDERAAPRLLAVGDLHVDSFGTWRDAEGRLAWGVDDFDDAYPLPYTNDLVRLATSVKINIDAGVVSVRLKDGCEAILDGYASTLRAGGCPIVLAEAHEQFEKLGLREIKPPPAFWDTLRALPAVRRGVPRGAIGAIRGTLPGGVGDYTIARRQAGTGSLGQPRYVMIAECDGGHIAREAKALIPSSCVWAAGRRGRRGGQPYYARAMRHAVRSPDPYQQVAGDWIVRRLSPDSNPIEVATLSGKGDEIALLRAMGVEAANVHAGSRRSIGAVRADLGRRPGRWLVSAAKTMARAMEQEWRAYRGRPV